MSDVDEFGMMEIDVAGRTERRPVEVVELGVDFSGRRYSHARPVVREGEMLVERLGGESFIVRTHT